MAVQTDPWAVVSVGNQPAQGGAAPQAAPDPWQVTHIGDQPAGVPDTSGGAGGAIERWGTNEGWQGALNPYGRGLAKSAAQTAGGLLDFFHWLADTGEEDFQSQYSAEHPEASDEELEGAWQQYQAQRGADHVQKAASWLREGTDPINTKEKVGAIGEQVLEFLTGEELLKLAGPVLKAGEAGEAARTLTAADKLKAGQQLAATMKANPTATGYMFLGIRAAQAARGAAAIGGRAAVNAAAAGAQSYLHTEDPDEARRSAEWGGGLSVAAEAPVAAARYLMKNSPEYVTRLGQTFPVMRAQLNEAGRIEQGNVAGVAPVLHEAQQAAVPGMIENVAQRAVRKAIGQINASRPVIEPAITDEARLLGPGAPGEAAQQFRFTLDTTPATETPTGGPSVQPAAKGVKLPYGRQTYTTSVEPQPIEGPRPRITSQGTMGTDISTTQVPPTEPNPRGEVIGGGGVLSDPDPRKAIQWVNDLEKQRRTLEGLRQVAEENNLPQEWKDTLDDRIQKFAGQSKSLNDQLALYYQSPYAQRFGAEDLPGMLDKVHDFSDAEAQLNHAAQPVYQTLDRISDNGFTRLNNQYKQARDMLSRTATTEAYDAALTRMNDANEKIRDLIERHRGDLSFDDYQAARNTWRQASRLGEMHALYEGMMNGITGEESATGLTRAMTRGSVTRFEKYLADDTNRKQIQELIGQDGIENLKEITGMFTTAKNNRAMQQVASSVYAYLRRGAFQRGIAATAFGGTLHLLGAPGLVAGPAYLAAEGTRMVLRDAATNPRIGKMLTWAATHDLDPRIYAPLIARAMTIPFERQKEPEGQGEEEQTPAAAGAQP